jgi:hypothetical protein
LKKKLNPPITGDKLKEFMTTKQTLQKILQGLLYTEEETRVRQEDVRKNKLF